MKNLHNAIGYRKHRFGTLFSRLDWKERIKEHSFILLPILLVTILCIKNYQPDTFLTGWDTLHPEFNQFEYLKRIFFGSYQPHQGLGAVASQSHAAELPRMLIYFLLSVILPFSFIRYAYFFLTMFTGVIGMYAFLHYLLPRKIASTRRAMLAALGGCFYLLNLGTLQHFYTPFEMFPTQFASLPWLFLYAIRFLKEDTYKYLFIFSLATLFASPMAHTATLWYAYIIQFFLYLFSVLVFRRKLYKRVILLIFISLLINIYWILPNLYFAVNHGIDVQSSKIHSLFNEEAFLKNVEFSTITDIALLRSFPFDWGIYRGKEQFAPLMGPWLDHMKNPLVTALGYTYFVIILSGIIYSIRRKNGYLISFIPIALVSLFFLLTTQLPFGFLFTFLQRNIFLFQEAFRFPFTKFSLVLVFCFSLYFCLGLADIIDFIDTCCKKHYRIVIPFFLLILFSLIIYMTPAFQGNFISPAMRVNIPKEYFQMFDWFQKNSDRGRVATFPVHSFWGWSYYSWGYQGAGFSWFGIPQPILEREFDRWSAYNEQYFKEISYAIYTKDKNLLKNVIRKYDIHFLLLDTSIIAPGDNNRELFYNQINDMFTDLLNDQFLWQYSKFGNHLYVYTVKDSNNYPLTTYQQLLFAQPKKNTAYKDIIYSRYGDYASDREKRAGMEGIYFPSLDLIDTQSKVNPNKIFERDNSIVLKLTPLENKTYEVDGREPFSSFTAANIIVEKKPRSLIISLYPILPIFDNQPGVFPIKGEIPLAGEVNHSFLSINGHLFSLDLVPQYAPFVLGSVILSPQENYITVYDAIDKAMNKLPSLTNTNIVASYCDNSDNSRSLVSYFTDNQIFLQKDPDKKICLTIPLSFVSKEINSSESMVSFSFQYNGASEFLGCVKKHLHDGCSYAGYQEQNSNTKRILFAVKNTDIDSSEILLQLMPQKKSSFESFSNVAIGEIISSFQGEITPEFIQRALNPYSSASAAKEVIIPKVILDNSSYDLSTQNRKTSDCFTKVSDSTKTMKQIEDKMVILYSSNEGSYCDHFTYDSLSHSVGYFVFIESKNDRGLPLNLCITSYTSKHCALYTKLTKENDFTTEVFFLPPLDKDGVGYDVNVENVGVKHTPSVNYLKSITFLPISFNILENIHTPLSPNKEIGSYPGIVNRIITYTPLAFFVETSEKRTLLNLSYSYEKGFKAYSIHCNDNFSCMVKTFLAPLIGEEITKHIEVNGWSNGWIVDTDGTNQQVAILFLPQYFEYAGFLILTIPFGAVAFLKRRHRSNSSQTWSS